MLELLHDMIQPTTWVMPLPKQLKSYLTKMHGIDTANKSSIVKHFKLTEGHPGRISSHLVEAYYLTRLAQDVLRGTWRYNLPSKELAPIPGPITREAVRCFYRVVPGSALDQADPDHPI
jgi:hypothetical protein